MLKFSEQSSQFKTWSFDIDGVINFYPSVWLDYIFQETKYHYETKDQARLILGEDYWILKEKYRLSDYKYQVPVNPDALYVITALKKRGDRVIISTTRPFDSYPLMKSQTKAWLDANGILFDLLISKKELYKENFDIHIDDELKDILQVKSKVNNKKFILLSSTEINSEVDDIDNVSSLRELI